LLSVAAAVYFLAHLLVAAAPVVMLASCITISRVASNTSRRVVGQWGGAGGAVCEDHFALAWSVLVLRRGGQIGFTGWASAHLSTPTSPTLHVSIRRVSLRDFATRDLS
jgi:hypothetical protein